MDTEQKRKRILIADDIKANIVILQKVLEKDFDVAFVQDGISVLRHVESNPVDLILLDILMPEMDGYEVCRNLKANESTKNIPVIFITSKSKAEDEARGFELGAVDYITKPFSFPIVKVRVKTHLALKEALEDLEHQNEALRETAALREDVERITRHDLKSPLVSVIGYSELGLLNPSIDGEVRDCLETIRDSGYIMLEMINLSLDLVKMERKTYKLEAVEVDLLKIIRKILADFGDQLETKNVSCEIAIEGVLVSENSRFAVQSEELLCYSMFLNLIKNALEATPDNETIRIEMREEEDSIISIRNKGLVPDEIRDTFFEKYSTFGKKKGTGLGTYSAKLIIETHGGTIGFESHQDIGTVVTVRFPGKSTLHHTEES